MERNLLIERTRSAETALRDGRAEEARSEFDALASILRPAQMDAIRGRILHGQLSARCDLAMRGLAMDDSEALETAALSLAEGAELGPLEKDALLSVVADSASQRGDDERALCANRRSLECLCTQGESRRTLQARLAVAQACMERGVVTEALFHFREIIRLLTESPQLIPRPGVASRYKALARLRLSQQLISEGHTATAHAEADAGLCELNATDPKNARLREELQLILDTRQG